MNGRIQEEPWTLPFLEHPRLLFDRAAVDDRFLRVLAPMVRYGKLAFRQTVHAYGTDLCYTPMILAKEFNRSPFARDSDLSVAQTDNPPTIVQFGANVPQELCRASQLALPFVNGVDLNCGCPQSWACAEVLGAALMERRELVRDMLAETRKGMTQNGWLRHHEIYTSDVTEDLTESMAGLSTSGLSQVPEARHLPREYRGRSLSVKIRVHKDLRKTMDWIDTVLFHARDHDDLPVDWLTIHPRTRNTPSSTPIFVESLQILTEKYSKHLPILLSGDVFTLSALPFPPTFTVRTGDDMGSRDSDPPLQTPKPSTTGLAGFMSARGLLANPALYAGYEACPWEAVEAFMARAMRAPLPLRVLQHHLTEMCGPGMGPDKNSLLTKAERSRLTLFTNVLDVVDFLDEIAVSRYGRSGGMMR